MQTVPRCLSNAKSRSIVVTQCIRGECLSRFHICPPTATEIIRLIIKEPCMEWPLIDSKSSVINRDVLLRSGEKLNCQWLPAGIRPHQYQPNYKALLAVRETNRLPRQIGLWPRTSTDIRAFSDGPVGGYLSIAPHTLLIRKNGAI